MRRFSILIVLLAAFAAHESSGQPRRPQMNRGPVMTAERSIKEAAEVLVSARKGYERNIEVLRHVRLADDALADAMQPTIAMQKAYDEIQEAKRLSPEFYVMQGVITVERALESARLSPASADFGKLRSMMKLDAVSPASRVVVRDASALGEEIGAWLKIQELVAAHVRSLSDITSQSLRAAEQ